MGFWVETGRSSISGSRRRKEAPSDSSGTTGQVQHGAGAGEACEYHMPRGAAALTHRASPGRQRGKGQPGLVEGEELVASLALLLTCSGLLGKLHVCYSFIISLLSTFYMPGTMPRI